LSLTEGQFRSGVTMGDARGSCAVRAVLAGSGIGWAADAVDACDYRGAAGEFGDGVEGGEAGAFQARTVDGVEKGPEGE
jgi:hypothetical protein